MSTPARPTASESMIDISARDGFTLQAFRVRPKGLPRAGLIVLQEIFGLTEQMKSVVRSYADEGYDTIFPCLFDRVERGLVVPVDEPARGRDLAYGLDLGKVRLDVDAAAQILDNPHGVFVIGFCWGGGVLVDLAERLNLAGAIAFYGTRLDTYLKNEPKCPLLFHFGETDPNSKPELIAAVRAAYPDAETYVYPAGHAFANDARPSYVAEAAKTARDRTLAFMQRHAA